MSFSPPSLDCGGIGVIIFASQADVGLRADILEQYVVQQIKLHPVAMPDAGRSLKRVIYCLPVRGKPFPSY